MSKLERRTSFAELRASEGDEMALVGYACSFNVLSQPLDMQGTRERIAPGAFKRSLAAGDDVHCLINHDANQVLGRRKNGTLTCEEDSRGLKFRCQLNPNSSRHQDFWQTVKRGDIDQCSFAFVVDDGGDEYDQAEEDGQRFRRRTLRSVSLMDVSAVTYPAYNADNATVVQARSLPNFGVKDFIAYAKRRAKELGREIIFDQMNLTTARAWESVDHENRKEAERIGKLIASDSYEIDKQQRADDELKRKMAHAAGRLVK